MCMLVLFWQSFIVRFSVIIWIFICFIIHFHRSANNKGGSSSSGHSRENKVLDEKRVFITSLSWDIDSQQLKDIVSGEMGANKVVGAEVLQRKNGRSLGCGTVEFKTADAAKDAIRTLYGKEFNGRAITVREYYQDN